MSAHESSGPTRGEPDGGDVKPPSDVDQTSPTRLLAETAKVETLYDVPFHRAVNPLDAAFQVGRLLNQLAFHLRLAWLLPNGRDQVEAVRLVGNRLGGAMNGLFGPR